MHKKSASQSFSFVKMSCSITLYTAASPNAYKVAILLELLELKYQNKAIALSKGEQKEPSFLEINIDGKIPALKDESLGVALGQSGAIMQYLVEKYDQRHLFSFAPDTTEGVREREILFLQTSELGPPVGLAGSMLFRGVKNDELFACYVAEVKRAVGALENYMKDNESNGSFFVGTHYSTADISVYPFFSMLERLGIDKGNYPLLSKWHQAMSAIPAVRRGMEISK